MKRLVELGGVIASIILIILGIGAVTVGVIGRADVSDQIAREKIAGTPDMTPGKARATVEKAGLTEKVEIPDCSVAGEKVDDGDSARCFADYIRVHTLEATHGQTYSEMARFVDESGKPTEDESQAAKDPKTGEPRENEARQIWITSTALGTALNTSYFAQQVALFSIVMGIALILIGIGFLVVTSGQLRERAG